MISDFLSDISDIPFYYKDIIYSKIRYYLQSYYNIQYTASQINDNIFISDLPSSCNIDLMKEDGITHILSTVLGLEPFFPEDFIYKNVHVRDVEHQDLSPYFDESVEFIKEAINSGGKVLVHCSYGVSRSVSMVIAYLIKEKGMTYQEAYELVKSKRQIAKPNIGFMKQLIIYELENK